MSHSHKDGHGRCQVCGDDGEARRQREEEIARVDEREDPNPRESIQTDDALARADQPLLLSPLCDREQCMTWRACVACRTDRQHVLAELVQLTEEAGGYPELRVCPQCDGDGGGNYGDNIPDGDRCSTCDGTGTVDLEDDSDDWDDHSDCEQCTGYSNDDVDDEWEILAWTPDEDLDKPIVLTEEAWAEFTHMIENPPEPTQALRDLFARCANHNLADCPQCGAYLIIGETQE